MYFNSFKYKSLQNYQIAMKFVSHVWLQQFEAFDAHN